MNKLFKVIALMVLVTLVGCNDNTAMGEGTNKDRTARTAELTPAQMDEAYGEVVHRGTIATKAVIEGNKLSEGVTSVVFVNRNTQPSLVTFVCENRGNNWGVVHNTLSENGAVTDATEMSIMNYAKGVKDIREVDDSANPVFSTANGDTNIYNGLMAIGKLDPESTIAFTFEKRDNEGNSITEGWSALFVVKDVVKALRSVNLADCKNAEIDPEQGPEIQYYSTSQLRAMAKG